MINIIDISGMILLLIGTWLLGKHNNNGWLITMAGGICFLIIAIPAKLYGLVTFQTIYSFLATHNYLKGRIKK